MGAILTDPHIDTRMKRCILMTAIVPKLIKYAGEVWEMNAKFIKQPDSVQMTPAKNTLGCSSATSKTAV